MDDIRQQVRTMILTKFLEGQPASMLKDEVSLERSHIVDSVRALEIILFIEETYGIQVENDDAIPENFDTVSNIVGYVQRKRGQ
ncbi:MAG: acyl carrier protein [Myxococcales bacterium]|nr:acyl carrier protein [Myxococcales bacterium]